MRYKHGSHVEIQEKQYQYLSLYIHQLKSQNKDLLQRVTLERVIGRPTFWGLHVMLFVQVNCKHLVMF